MMNEELKPQGLLNQQPQEEEMPMQEDEDQEEETSSEEENEASDEEQGEMSPEYIKDQIVEAMPKQFERAFAQVVKAGMKVLFSDETHELMLDELEQEGDIAESSGKAIAGLMMMLYEKSNKTMPPEVIIPAGTYLMAEAADFIEKVTGETLTGEMLGNATAVMTESLMGAFGVDAQKFVSASEQAMAKYSEGQA